MIWSYFCWMNNLHQQITTSLFLFHSRMRYPPYSAKKDSWIEFIMAKKPQRDGIRGFWPFTFLAMIFAAVVAVSNNKSWLDLALFILDHSGVARTFPDRRVAHPERENEQSLRKNEKNWSRFEENCLRKVELLPTWDCETGYGPAGLFWN